MKPAPWKTKFDGHLSAPGIRGNYHPSYFAAFLLDPDGNKVEAVFHHAEA